MTYDYTRDGFVHLPGALSAEEVAELRQEADRLLSAHGVSSPWDGKWLADFEKREYSLNVVKHLCTLSSAWQKAAVGRAVMAQVERLIGPAKLVASMLIAKPPETGQPFPLHQDAAYYGEHHKQYCIVVVHLDDTTSENGALRFLPGLHTKGLLPHKRDGKAYLRPEQYRMEDTIEVQAKAGDLVAFSLFTPHASYPNRSKLPRVTARLGYVPL